MLRKVEAIIGLELCEQSCAERAVQCQGKIHASEAARSAAERARYQGINYTPHDLSTPPPPPSEIMRIRPCLVSDPAWNLRGEEMKGAGSPIG